MKYEILIFVLLILQGVSMYYEKKGREHIRNRAYADGKIAANKKSFELIERSIKVAEDYREKSRRLSAELENAKDTEDFPSLSEVVEMVCRRTGYSKDYVSMDICNKLAIGYSVSEILNVYEKSSDNQSAARVFEFDEPNSISISNPKWTVAVLRPVFSGSGSKRVELEAEFGADLDEFLNKNVHKEDTILSVSLEFEAEDNNDKEDEG